MKKYLFLEKKEKIRFSKHMFKTKIDKNYTKGIKLKEMLIIVTYSNKIEDDDDILLIYLYYCCKKIIFEI